MTLMTSVGEGMPVMKTSAGYPKTPTGALSHRTSASVKPILRAMGPSLLRAPCARANHLPAGLSSMGRANDPLG
jgi:hypothetical protein